MEGQASVCSQALDWNYEGLYTKILALSIIFVSTYHLSPREDPQMWFQIEPGNV